MTSRAPLTQARLRELLHYDPRTGLWTWRVVRGPANVGDLAGAWHRKGCITICIDGVHYLAHRLAFLYMVGSIPDRVNHKNDNRADNRWKNLREVTPSQVGTSRTYRNRLGVKGVFRNGVRFTARIKIDYASIYLGTYDTPTQAHKAYLKAAKEYHGDFARAA